MKKHYMTVMKRFKIILAFLFYAALVFAFKELAEGVVAEATLDLDVAVLETINARSSRTWNEIIPVLTDLAGPVIIPAVTVILIGFFIWTKEAYNGLYIALTLGGTFLVNTLLKLYYHRTRPELWELLVEEQSFSFPSGHAMISMALALSLIVLVWNSYWRIPSLILGGLYILGIGYTRLYLGVHYPTDILGGWLASIIWVGMVTKIMMNRSELFRVDTRS